MLEVRHLEIVDAIARAGSVTAAARRLHLTQPAVSHALGDLEGRLGMSLFRREPRGMAITAEGERLLRAARTVLDAVAEAEHDLALVREGYQGTVRVGSECYTCYHWLPPILAHFSEDFPDVSVVIAADAIDDPIAALAEDRLDLAIVHSEVAHPELATEELFDDELVAVLPATHPLAGLDNLDPRHFSDQTLLFHSDPEASALVTHFLDPAGIRPARVLVLRLTEALLATVRAGLGITVMAQWAVRPELKDGTLVARRLGPDGLHRRWRLVTRRDRVRRATIQELARLLKDSCLDGPMHEAHM